MTCAVSSGALSHSGHKRTEIATANRNTRLHLQKSSLGFTMLVNVQPELNSIYKVIEDRTEMTAQKTNSIILDIYRWLEYRIFDDSAMHT